MSASAVILAQSRTECLTLRALEVALVAAHHAGLQRDEEGLLPSDRAQKRDVEIALSENKVRFTGSCQAKERIHSP